MCLDADDSLEPETFDRLRKVVRKESPDIIDFGARLIAGASRPTTRVVPMGRFHGDAVFEKVFVEHFYSWSLCFKLIRADLCRRGAELIPPDYCVVAEDFSMFTAIAGYAQHYEPLFRPGYRYTLCAGCRIVCGIHLAGTILSNIVLNQWFVRIHGCDGIWFLIIRTELCKYLIK